jgi:hypothetical protein
MCSTGLACTASDQVCRSAEIFILGANGTDAATATAVVMRGSGANFTFTPIGTGLPVAIWGTSASDVWVVAITSDAQNTQLSWMRHWDGVSWSQPVNFAGNVQAIWGDAPTNYWAVTNGGGAYHWTGSSWGSVQTVISGAVFSQIWGNNTTNIWALAGNQMARGNGLNVWDVTTRSDFTASPLSISGRASGQMFSGGAQPSGMPAVLHWDGTQYSVTPLGASGDCGAVAGVWAGPDDAWAIANVYANSCLFGGVSNVWKRPNGGTWALVGPLPTGGANRGLFGTSNRDLYAIGSSGGTVALHHYDGATWTAPYKPSGLTAMWAVWGTGQPK